MLHFVRFPLIQSWLANGPYRDRAAFGVALTLCLPLRGRYLRDTQSQRIVMLEPAVYTRQRSGPHSSWSKASQHGLCNPLPRALPGRKDWDVRFGYRSSAAEREMGRALGSLPGQALVGHDGVG